ncbi:MAG: PDZ domain-containing protein [Chloroflexi bacterium]|nr:PDZ domain-containing protein [Chloroflexota bacterium]
MKRLIPVAVIVAGALAFSAIAAVRLSGADASDDTQAALPPTQPSPSTVAIDSSPAEPSSANGNPQTRQQGAYVGIALAGLSEDEADALGIKGGAIVKSVMRDSPADGLLEEEDVIASVEGEAVSSPRDVVDAVRSSSPEVVMTFTIIRGGDTMNVEVTLGEREGAVFTFNRHEAASGHGLAGRFHGMGDGVVRSEFVTETDDGFQTTRTIVGTVENVDVEAGTFDLVPVDGTDTVHFEIDDATRVLIDHDGDISGLSSGERTLVVEVETADGDRIVKLVSQGQGRGRFGPSGHFGPGGNFGGGLFRRPGSRFGGSHDGLSFEAFPGRLPNVREHLRSFLSDEALDDLRERGFGLERFLDKIPGELGGGQ